MSAAVGDHVEIGSLVRIRRARNRRSVLATGVVTGFNACGVVVQLDHEVNGADWCTASPEELRVIAR